MYYEKIIDVVGVMLSTKLQQPVDTRIFTYYILKYK